MRFIFAIGVIVAGLSGVAFAQQQQEAADPAVEEGRYAVERSDDGSVLRVDKTTGQTSQCKREAGNWTCKAATEERSALEEEIGRLATENDRLRERVASLEKSSGTSGDRPTLELPSKEDVGKVMDFFSEMANRTYEFFDNLQRDFNKQSG